jgi:hypothetical protein
VVKSGRKGVASQSSIPFHEHKSHRMRPTQYAIDFWSVIEICLLDLQAKRAIPDHGEIESFGIITLADAGQN